MCGGILDDTYNLPPRLQILFPMVAVILVMYGGVGIQHITNPLGGIINMERGVWLMSRPALLGGGEFVLAWPGSLVTFLWLMGLTYTTKILDGLDGLATGITAIGAGMIAMLSLATVWFQPDIGIAALMVAGVLCGFLFFNFYPAKIFLGEGGSLLVGFILGVLAIISGSKIMTTLLVLGLPVLDVAWAIFRRWRAHKPVAQGDRGHIHHLLLDSGLSQRETVLFLCAIAFLFGIAGIFLSALSKVIVLGVLLLFAVALIAVLGAYRRTHA